MNSREFEEKIAEYAKEQVLFASGDRIAVALSGGADSVALLRVLLAMGCDCIALHCNFHLRGEESDRDETFVIDLCNKLNVPLSVKHFDIAEYKQRFHVSTEMACREVRYEWFSAKMKEESINLLAVAHHQDDNIETFFLNAVRGSGIQGLAGIKPRNGNVIRPLLCVSRQDIEQYLREKGQDFVVDSTNEENDYKRNKLRNVLLPMLNELLPESESGLLRTLNNISGCNELYAGWLDDFRESAISECKNGFVIDLKKVFALKKGQSTALFELLKPYGFNSEQVKSVYETCKTRKNVGQRYLSSECEIVLGRDEIEIFPKEIRLLKDEVVVELETLLNGECENEFLSARIEKKIVGETKISGIDGRTSIALNMRLLKQGGVLTLRGWRVGDRIKPYGMKGSKLVSDLFVDAKYSERQKRESLMLCAGDEVLWVLGLRSSGSYAVSGNDTEYIRMEVK